MVRVSVVYDKDLKEQVFMVRGDESYARKTKTVLEVVRVVEDVLSFKVVLRVDVLRDDGDSSINIYVNDSLETVISGWKSTSNKATVEIDGLLYGTDYVFSAKYIGNNKCSPSNSNKISMNREDTHRTSAIIELDDTVNYDPDNLISKVISLYGDIDNYNYYAEQDLIVYYDDVEIETVTTNYDGLAYVDVPSGSVGKHTLKVEFLGNNNVLPRTVTQDVSVGYQVVLSPINNVVFVGDSCTFQARVTDFLNKAQPNTIVKLYKIIGTTKFEIGSASTGSIGYVSFNRTLLENDTLLVAKMGIYVSNQITLKLVKPESLTITSSSPRLYKNETNTLTIQTNSTYAGTPVVLTGGLTDTLYTDGSGKVTASLTGTGKGSQSVTATFGSLVKSVSLTDYVQYWGLGGDYHPNPRQYSVLTNNLLDLNNCFRLNGGGTLVMAYPYDGKSYLFSLYGVTSSSTVNISPIVGESARNNLMSNTMIDTSLYQQAIKFNNSTLQVKITPDKIELYIDNQLKSSQSLIDSQPRNDYGFLISRTIDFTSLTVQEMIVEE